MRDSLGAATKEGLVLFRPLVVLGFLLSSTASAWAQGPTAAARDSEYHALLMRLRSKDTTIDFTMLRLALTKSSEYSPYGSDADSYRDSMRAALQRQDFRTVIGDADSALAIDYLDVRTHVLRAYAAEKLGDSTSASWDRIVAALLTRSIAQSGTGAVDSPYVVISVDEEYALLNMTGYQSGQQALGNCGPRPCDILEAQDRRTGAKRTFYFDISLPKGFLDRVLQSK